MKGAMAAPNRATLIAKTHKVLKQQYEAVKPDSDRPLLQQMLFACCLENAPYSAAEKVYARLSQNFFDWNEVRVSTVTELAEVMKELPEPSTAANNLKKHPPRRIRIHLLFRSRSAQEAEHRPRHQAPGWT